MMTARFPAGLWPSAAVAQRIVDAVGKRHTPEDIDLSSLRAALYEYRGDLLRKRSGAAEHRKAHRKAALRIAKRAGELRQLLKASGNGELDRELWFHLEHDAASAGLEEMERVANMLAEQDANFGMGGVSAFAVERLIPVYEQHFRPAGRSRHPYHGALSGPFIRFVQAVAGVSGVSISEHTIDAVLKKRGAIGKITFAAE